MRRLIISLVFVLIVLGAFSLTMKSVLSARMDTEKFNIQPFALELFDRGDDAICKALTNVIPTGVKKSPTIITTIARFPGGEEDSFLDYLVSSDGKPGEIGKSIPTKKLLSKKENHFNRKNTLARTTVYIEGDSIYLRILVQEYTATEDKDNWQNPKYEYKDIAEKKVLLGKVTPKDNNGQTLDQTKETDAQMKVRSGLSDEDGRARDGHTIELDVWSTLDAANAEDTGLVARNYSYDAELRDGKLVVTGGLLQKITWPKAVADNLDSVQGINELAAEITPWSRFDQPEESPVRTAANKEKFTLWFQFLTNESRQDVLSEISEYDADFIDPFLAVTPFYKIEYNVRNEGTVNPGPAVKIQPRRHLLYTVREVESNGSAKYYFKKIAINKQKTGVVFSSAQILKRINRREPYAMIYQLRRQSNDGGILPYTSEYYLQPLKKRGSRAGKAIKLDIPAWDPSLSWDLKDPYKLEVYREYISRIVPVGNNNHLFVINRTLYQTNSQRGEDRTTADLWNLNSKTGEVTRVGSLLRQGSATVREGQTFGQTNIMINGKRLIFFVTRKQHPKYPALDVLYANVKLADYLVP